MGEMLDEISLAFFNSTPNPGFLVNEDGTISLINSAACSKLQLKEDDTIGILFHKLFPVVAAQNNEKFEAITGVLVEKDPCSDKLRILVSLPGLPSFRTQITKSDPQICRDGVKRSIVYMNDHGQVEKLKDSYENSLTLLNAALSAIPEGFAIYDEEDRLQVFNQGYMDVYPDSVDAMKIGTRFEDILKYGLEQGQYEEAGFTEESRAAWLKERLKNHFNPTAPLVQHLKDGRYIRVDERVLDDGHIVGIRSNITELMETKSLAESLGDALDNIAAPVAFIDIETQRILYGNTAFLNNLQYTPDEITQLTLMDINHNANPEKISEFIDKIIENRGVVQQSRSQHVRKDGTVYPCVVNSICENGDNPKRILVFVEDESIEREIREELDYRRVQQETFIENLPVFIIRSDLDTTIHFANELYCDFFGVSLADIIGVKFTEFIHTEEIIQNLKNCLASLTMESPVRTYEQEMLSSDGIFRTVLWTNRLVFKDGEPHEVVSVGRDITDSKLAKAQIEEQAHALTLRNQALEQFAGIVSHDLRSPLRHIRLFGEMLMEEHESGNSENFGDYISRIRSSILRMESLISSLLEFSQVAYKQVNRSRFVLSTAIDEVKENLAQNIEQSGAVIKLQNDFDLNLDYVLFVRLMQNLIDNAIKYQKDDQPAQIQISADQTEKNIVCITVADNGIGIASEQASRIFNVFQRLHVDEKKYKGTGIGLALAKRIAEGHNGTLSLDTDYKDGSKFVLKVPI
ncbi:MAG: PAS domain S-box protein [Rhizobiaceae bacterium]|nr:PAS domain S-box protein [Rhizobiaceae bacterium]